MKTTIPKYSIILCTYNGSKKIGKSLQSLVDQDFPKEQYEIIVVDDGSTDNTVEVVSKFPVRIIKHTRNIGTASSRNSGLKNAHGEIIICYDDDCTADKKWLKNLSLAYKDKDVMGAGSIVNISTNSTLTDLFCYDMGYGNPTPLSLGRSKSVFVRLLDYVFTFFTNPQSNFYNGCEVRELPGIVASFRKSNISSVGGWNDILKSAAEDVDICSRLRYKFPNKKFVVYTSAIVVHEQKLSFFQYIKKEFLRGNNRKNYYTSRGLIPPIFPGPFLFLISLMVIGTLQLPIMLIFFLPFLLYPWWLYRLFVEKKMRLFFYPYMQLIYETSVISGMLIL